MANDVTCVVATRCRFIWRGEVLEQGDPLVVPRDVFEQYEGTHLQEIADEAIAAAGEEE